MTSEQWCFLALSRTVCNASMIVFHNAIGSSEETLLDGGVNDVVGCEIIFKASSEDLVKELSHSSSLGNRPEVFWLGGITSFKFGEENDVCRIPVGGGLV